MNTIEQPIIEEYTIQKSKFICLLFPILSIEEITNIQKQTKKQYPNATHYCYAYIINSTKKCSDDGEPTGTAGFPILNILEKKQLDFILCIIVRYFGGIKLGTGGLTRAYSTVTKLTIEKTNLIEYEKGKEYKIIFSYTHQSKIDYLLKNSDIITKEYQENICYDFITDITFKIDSLKEYCLSIETIKETWKPKRKINSQ